MRKYIPIVAVAAVVAVAVGLIVSRDNKSNDSNTTNSANSSQQTDSNGSKNDNTNVNSPASTDKVSISGFAFSPSHITVKKGTTVTWTNNDSVTHTVSKDSAGGPDSKNLNSGDTYSFTFNDTGTFGYHCNIHQSMHGTVEVTE